MILLLIGAVIFDWVVGDPKCLPHPVQFMGLIIDKLRINLEKLAGYNKLYLRLSGILITLLLVSISGYFGWLIERIFINKYILPKWLGTIIVIVALTSTLAAKSLRDSVLLVIDPIKDHGFSNEKLILSRNRLSRIVGRDVRNLNHNEIYRAAAESASENSVDGIFAPLFWMIIGIILWMFSTNMPGPLSLAFIFKSTSTIDSMLGYKRGKLKWLGTAGAKLDDYLTWLPCRFVFITLPLISVPINRWRVVTTKAWEDGVKDDSPNSGLSEAIFAYCSDVRMGGYNLYGNDLIYKPIISSASPEASFSSVKKILNLSLRLEICWIICITLIILMI